MYQSRALRRERRPPRREGPSTLHLACSALSFATATPSVSQPSTERRTLDQRRCPAIESWSREWSQTGSRRSSIRACSPSLVAACTRGGASCSPAFGTTRALAGFASTLTGATRTRAIATAAGSTTAARRLPARAGASRRCSSGACGSVVAGAVAAPKQRDETDQADRIH
jgi:hypothetical protein